MKLAQLTTPRGLLTLAALMAAGSMASGYYVQHVEGIEPCPLCIVQRLAYISGGSLALLGAVLGSSPWVLRLFAALASLCALGGGGVAAWQCWLIAHPPEWMSCGRPFAWMLENNSLVALIPKLFKGEGDCLTVTWTMLGLSIPQWSVIIFSAFLVLTLTALFKRR
jgi:disulfide bond formation protein DsbB